MPKIPRSTRGLAATDFVPYNPSKPLMAPLGLADYSGAIGALQTGAKLVADKFKQNRDIEDTTARETATLEMETGSDEILKAWGDNKKQFNTIQERNDAAVADYEAKQKAIALKTSAQTTRSRALLDTMFKKTRSIFDAELRKNETKHVISMKRASNKTQEDLFIRDLLNPLVSINDVNRRIQNYWNGRKLDLKAGSRYETAEGYTNNMENFRKRAGEAKFNRFVSIGETKAALGVIAGAADQTGAITDPNNRLAIGAEYSNWKSFIDGIRAGDFAEFFPDENANMLVIKANNRLQSAMTQAATIKKTAGKKEYYEFHNEILERVYMNHEAPTYSQIQHLKILAKNAGISVSSRDYKYFSEMGNEPSQQQVRYFDLIQQQFSDLKYKAASEGIVPDYDVFQKTIHDQLDKGFLHVSQFHSLMADISKSQGARSKDIAAMTKTISDELNLLFAMDVDDRPAGAGPYPFKALNGMLGQDLYFTVERHVQSAFNEAASTGKGVNPLALKKDVADLIVKGIGRQDPSSINIPEQALRSVYEKKRRGAELSSMDELIFGMAEVKRNRNAAFFANRRDNRVLLDKVKAGGLVKKDVFEIRDGSYKHWDFKEWGDKDRKEVKKYVDFLRPGGYSYGAVYDEYFNPDGSPKGQRLAGGPSSPVQTPSPASPSEVNKAGFMKDTRTGIKSEPGPTAQPIDSGMKRVLDEINAIDMTKLPAEQRNVIESLKHAADVALGKKKGGPAGSGVDVWNPEAEIVDTGGEMRNVPGPIGENQTVRGGTIIDTMPSASVADGSVANFVGGPDRVDVPPGPVAMSDVNVQPAQRTPLVDVAGSPRDMADLTVPESPERQQIVDAGGEVRDVPGKRTRQVDFADQQPQTILPFDDVPAIKKLWARIPDAVQMSNYLSEKSQAEGWANDVSKWKQKIKEAIKLAKEYVDFSPDKREIAKDVVDLYLGSEAPAVSSLGYKRRMGTLENRLENGTLSEEQKSNLDYLLTFNSEFDEAFMEELATVTLTSENLLDYMTYIYMGETSLGTQVKDSSTGALGELQVLPTTLASVIAQGQFGDVAAMISGFSDKQWGIYKVQAKIIDKLKRDKKHTKAAALAESVFGDNLRNNTAFNFMAGAAKMLQALKQKKDKGE